MSPKHMTVKAMQKDQVLLCQSQDLNLASRKVLPSTITHRLDALATVEQQERRSKFQEHVGHFPGESEVTVHPQIGHHGRISEVLATARQLSGPQRHVQGSTRMSDMKI